VLPLGYSFNLDGTMMYCTFASIFIAQTYKIEMSLGTQLAMLATLMIGLNRNEGRHFTVSAARLAHESGSGRACPVAEIR